VNNLLDTLKALGPARLAAMAAISAATIAFFIYLTGRLATPEMALLYGDLEASESSQIAARLEEAGVPYRMDPDGGRIFVPQEQVARMRVAMAEDGLPSGGSIGYELFDQSQGLGQSNFVQNINHVRALEGELARTIRSISRVKHARVHLVLPQRELFSRDRQKPSASIVVAMQGNAQLDGQQVLAIRHIVAAAVPGLQPKEISIVDSNGNLLARSAAEGDLQGTATTAEEMRAAFEARTARSIEELLARSVGPGNVRVEVTAEMDFDRVTENAEIFDPESQVVRSTQTVEESADSRDGETNPPVTVGANLPDASLPGLDGQVNSESRSQRTEETVNYEISKTVRTHVREAGLVRRLSVAVLVNGSFGAGQDGERVYQERSPEELEQLAALVRSASGYDEARGDMVKVVNLPFVDLSQPPEDTIVLTYFGLPQADLMRAAELTVLGIIAVLLLLFVVRPLLKQALDVAQTARSLPQAQQSYLGIPTDPHAPQTAFAGPNLPLGQGQVAALTQSEAGSSAQQLTASGETIDEEIEQVIDVNRVEGQLRASSLRRITDIVENQPEEAAAVIRGWLYQDH